MLVNREGWKASDLAISPLQGGITAMRMQFVASDFGSMANHVPFHGRQLCISWPAALRSIASYFTFYGWPSYLRDVMKGNMAT